MSARILGVWLLLANALVADDLAAQRDDYWPHWRGPRGNGVAPRATPPLHWDRSTNVQWKVALAGEGSATPIVWQDRVFVVAAVPSQRKAEKPPVADPRAKTEPPPNFYEFVVECLDRNTGRRLWRHVAREAVPHEGRHPTNSYASGSPTTDGQRLYVSFGSRGLFCYDLNGKLLWQRELGELRTRYGWGEAVTPVIHEDSLIVNCDQEENSYLVVLNAATGETRWRVDRDEPTSWSTPVVARHGARTQVIVSATNRVRSYDLANGESLWQCGGLTVNVIPTPIVSEDTVYCLSGYRGAAALAIPLDATGDLTNSDRLRWRHGEATPYVPSGILFEGQLYFTRENAAIISSLDAQSGKTVFGPQRLPGLNALYASPIAAAGRIYFVGRDGTTVVLRPGKQLEVLATNRLEEPIDASPVAVGRQLLLRTAEHLYCLAEPEAGAK